MRIPREGMIPSAKLAGKEMCYRGAEDIHDGDIGIASSSARVFNKRNRLWEWNVLYSCYYRNEAKSSHA